MNHANGGDLSQISPWSECTQRQTEMHPNPPSDGLVSYVPAVVIVCLSVCN